MLCRSDAKVELECRLNLPFDREPIWTKDGQEISKSSPCFKRENTPVIKKLIIVKFNQNDAGDYKCVCDTVSTIATIKMSGKKILNIHCSVDNFVIIFHRNQRTQCILFSMT